LCNLLNIQHGKTAAYHPLSNDLVKCFHPKMCSGPAAPQLAHSCHHLDHGVQFTSSCGPPYATCSTSSMPRQQPTTHNPMVCSNASTATSKTCSGPTHRRQLDRPPVVGTAGPLLSRQRRHNTTPTQAVFSSPLILLGQFSDYPELTSDEFLTQISRTLSAAEHHSTGHNTAAAQWPPPKPPDALAPH